MVFCCDCGDSYSPEEQALTSDIVGKYTGDRRSLKFQEDDTIMSSSESELVVVMIPEGVKGGQIIRVRNEDGSRKVNAIVPEGMREGQMLMVRLPIISNPPSFAMALNDFLTPTPDCPEAIGTPVGDHKLTRPTEYSRPILVQGEASEAHVLSADDEEREAVDSKPSKSLTQALEEFFLPKPDALTPDEKLILVKVPPGLMAGSKMYVEVPDENRTLEVIVPPNCSAFNVAYTPRNSNSASSPSDRPLQAYATHAGDSTPGQNLLLVRVPLGTPPGTTLHVSVPDEPGRIIAAMVPSGNVKEFHVSYVPRETNTSPQISRGMLPPAKAYEPQRSIDSSWGADSPQFRSARQGTKSIDPRSVRIPKSDKPERYESRYPRTVNSRSRYANATHGNDADNSSMSDWELPTDFERARNERLRREKREQNRSDDDDWLLSGFGATAFGAAGLAALDHFTGADDDNTKTDEYDSSDFDGFGFDF